MNITYLEDYCIPGKDYSEDAFFLDTNYLIAFINPSHPFHLSTVIHTMFLIQQRARLYINDIVLSEAVDVLARGVYTEEKFHEWLNSQDHQQWLAHHKPLKKEYNVKKDEIRKTYISAIVKNHTNPDLLKYYNRRSTEQIEGFIQSRLFKLVSNTFATLERGLQFAKSIPLQSNDAFIVASAANQSASLLTFDKDFMKTTIIDSNEGYVMKVFSLKMKNRHLYGMNSQRHMDFLDSSLKHIIEQVAGGQRLFEEKFGISHDEKRK